MYLLQVCESLLLSLEESVKINEQQLSKMGYASVMNLLCVVLWKFITLCFVHWCAFCFQGWRETKEPNGRVVLWTISSSRCTWRYASGLTWTSVPRYTAEWCSCSILADSLEVYLAFMYLVWYKVSAENTRLEVNAVRCSGPERVFW